jgi:hypothetical protein
MRDFRTSRGKPEARSICGRSRGAVARVGKSEVWAAPTRAGRVTPYSPEGGPATGATVPVSLPMRVTVVAAQQGSISACHAF